MDGVVVPDNDIAWPEVRAQVVALEEVAVDGALNRDHAATSEPDPAQQARPATPSVRGVLLATLATGRVAVGDSSASNDAALVHADDAYPVDGRLPGRELRAFGYDVVAESLDGSEGLFLSVSAIRASVRQTVCWLTAGSPTPTSQAANSCCGTDGSSSSQAYRRVRPASVTAKGVPPVLGRSVSAPASRWSASQQTSEARLTAKRATTASREASPCW